MNILDIIEVKKRGGELTDAQIDQFVDATIDPATPIYKLKNPLLDYMESFRQLLRDDSKHKRYHRVKHNDDYFQQ